MVIKLIEDKEVWDLFVDQSPYGTLFHKWNFLRIMEKHTGYELLPYGIYNGTICICIIPLFFKKLKGIKTIFSPPLVTGVVSLGFVMSKEFDTLKQSKKETYLNIVTEEFNAEMKKISPNYERITLVSNFLDTRTFQSSNYSVCPYFTYVINLNLSLDEIFNGFKKELRSELRKVDPSIFRLSETKDISTFYELEKEKYIQRGLNDAILGKNYLRDLVEEFPDNLKLTFLYDNNDDIVVTQLSCQYKDRITLWQGGAKSQKYSFINEYRVWEIIKEAKNDGYKKLDLGGGPANLSVFKSKFNPELDMYFTLDKKDNLGKFAEWSYKKFRNIYSLRVI